MLPPCPFTTPKNACMAPDITAMKGHGPIVALTAYHAHTAAIADRYCDFLLVGDSLGMVMHGYETTVPVPLELMIMHGRAVVRGAKRALVVVDMPFGSYEESPAGRLPQRGPRDEGDRLRRGEDRGRPAHGRDDPLSGRARHSRDVAYRPDAAVGERHRRLQGAGAQQGAVGGDRGGRAPGGRGRRLRAWCSRR